MIDMDVRDLACIERALDSLEKLHDVDAVGKERVRTCLCSAAASWRQARDVTVAWRRALGLKVRLLDTV